MEVCGLQFLKYDADYLPSSSFFIGSDVTRIAYFLFACLLFKVACIEPSEGNFIFPLSDR